MPGPRREGEDLTCYKVTARVVHNTEPTRQTHGRHTEDTRKGLINNSQDRQTDRRGNDTGSGVPLEHVEGHCTTENMPTE